MEIEFIHKQKELVISKVIFTETKIYCSNVFPDRKPEVPDNNNKLIRLNLSPSFYGRYDPLGMSNFVSLSGEVNIHSLKSILYSLMADKFSLWIRDNDDNSLFITLQYTVIIPLYKVQIIEVLRNLSIVAFPVLINSIISNLSDEKPIKIGHIDLFINGVRLDWNRIFKMDKILVSWTRLTYKIQNNNITIKEYNSPFIKSEISTSSENVCLLPHIIDIMQKRNF